MSIYLGTTPLAGITSLGNIVDAFYPVGSVFIGTTSTCPLAAIKGTWTLVSSGIVKAGNIPCKGNGTALGITDGSNNYGVTATQYSASYQLYQGRSSAAYGANVGTTGNTSDIIAVGTALGVTTDSSKSGIVADTSSLTLSVNIWERTA